MKIDYSKMTIFEILRLAKAERIEHSRNLTIEQLLEKLSNYEQNARFVLSNGKHLGGGFDSYRGYYDDLCLEYADKQDDVIGTVEELVNLIKRALQRGEMTGYKGGEFPINGGTLVWTGIYGTTSESMMIVGVESVGDKVVLLLQEEEW